MRPRVSEHNKHRWTKYFRKRLSKSGVLAMSSKATMICNGRSSVAYTSDFRWPQKKKSKIFGFWKNEYQATGPPSAITLPGYVTWRWLCITIEKCVVAPSCMNHAFWCSVTGTSFSNSGKSGKFAYVQVSSTVPLSSTSPQSFSHRPPRLAHHHPNGYYFCAFH
ncbi:hypothetical protein TNCV_2323191 [Trichonephila clavipes]|nr:hypothetical protein TNCV_2323191 [Trichonephila clavipes]